MAVYKDLECRNPDCAAPTHLKDVMVSPAVSEGGPLLYRPLGETQEKEALCEGCRGHLSRVLSAPHIGSSTRAAETTTAASANDAPRSPSEAVSPKSTGTGEGHSEVRLCLEVRAMAQTKDGRCLPGKGTIVFSEPSGGAAPSNRAPNDGYLN